MEEVAMKAMPPKQKEDLVKRIMREMATPQMEVAIVTAMTPQRMEEVVMRAMTPQRMEEMLRRILREMPPQRRKEVVLSEMATQEMEDMLMTALNPQQKEELLKRIIRELDPQRMEELIIAMATEVETPLETLDSLMSTVNISRMAIISVIALVVLVLSEIEVPRLPESACYTLAVSYVLISIDRIFGIYASYQRKDPQKKFLWSICSTVACIPPYLTVAWYYSQKRWPSMIAGCILPLYTVVTGMSPSSAHFFNVWRFRPRFTWKSG